MNAYSFNRVTGEYIGIVAAQPDQRTAGAFLLPRNSTWIAPGGSPPAGKRWLWNGRVWQAFDIPPPEPPPPERVKTPAEIQNDEDIAAAKSYPKLVALQTMRPAEAMTWIDNNTATLAALRDTVKTLTVAVMLLSRRL